VLQVQLWSRLGRLKRSNFPKMTGGGHTFGGGAAPGLMSVLAGRLLCDTYLSGALVCTVLHLDTDMHVILLLLQSTHGCLRDSHSAAVCSLGLC
jgi:DNA polymerase alpha subunit A